MPLRRLLMAAALLALGAAAFLRLRLHAEPEQSERALEVSVRVPASEASDQDVLAERCLVPVESAVRATGGVVSITGDVSPLQATLTVRLAAGVDVVARAARLSAALQSLERALPEGSSVHVDLAGRSAPFDLLVAVAPAGDAAGRVAFEEVRRRLERVPGVRSVRLEAAREARDVVRLASRDPELRIDVSSQLSRRLLPESLGRVRAGGRELEAIAAAPDVALAEAPVVLGRSVVRAGALGLVARQPVERQSAMLLDGHDATLAAIVVDPGASLLAADRAVRAEVNAITRAGMAEARVLRSQADSLRRQAARLAAALVAVGVIAAALAGWVSGRAACARMALAPLLGAAAASNAVFLFGVRLDPETLPMAALGIVAALPWHALRASPRPVRAASVALAAGCGALPFLAVMLVPSLGVVLGARSSCFGLAFAAAVLSALVLPARVTGPGRLLRSRRVRDLARDPLTTGLVAITACAALLTWFGKSLDPRRRAVAVDRSVLDASLMLPEGTSLEVTMTVARETWGLLERTEAIEHGIGFVSPGRIDFDLDVAPRHRSAARHARLRSRLAWELGATGATVRIEPRMAARGTSLERDDLGRSRAETGERLSAYRYVLRSASARELVSFEPRLRERVGAVLPWWLSRVRAPLGRGALRLALEPRGLVTASEMPGLAARLQRESLPPGEVVVPVDPPRRLLVTSSGDRDADDPAPPLPDLLDRPLRGEPPLSVRAKLTPRLELTPPTVRREDGRFVARVDVPLPHHSEDTRRDIWKAVDRAVERTHPPSGIVVERPDPRPGDPVAAHRRLLLLAALLPALALGATTALAGSWAQGLLALVPALLAVAAATPMLALPGGALDDGGLAIGIAALVAGLPLSVRAASALGVPGARPSRPASGHRRARELAGAWAVLGAGALALAASTAGMDAARDPWVLGLRLAALLLAVQAAGVAFVVPSAVALVAGWRRRDPVQVARMRRPPEWSVQGSPHLEVRRLTKVYGGGHRALHDVSIDLHPGVIGLVGPNGAGKTTLLRTLTGLLGPTRGEVLWRGAPVVPANVSLYRQEVGYLPQGFNAYEGFTGEQFLDFWAVERGMTDAAARRRELAEKLALVGLSEHARRRVRDYSGGMRQRLGIARAMLGDPRFLIVDEPSTGLDVESRDRLREALLAYSRDRIVLLSTHVASDIEATASRVLLLHRGRLRLDTDPAALIERAAGSTRELIVSDAELRDVSRLHRVTRRVRTMQGVRVRLVLAAGADPLGEAVRPTLEEAYLAELDALEPGRQLGRSLARLARWE